MSARAARVGATDVTNIALLEDGALYGYLIEKIRTAERSIWAHVYSFNLRPPDDGQLFVRSVARALDEARGRGVDVRVLLGGHNRRPLGLPAGNLLALRFLAGLGVACRVYSSEGERASHAKYFIVDGSALICGSHNWSPRALSRGSDTSVAVQSRTVASGARALFLDAWKQGAPLGEDASEVAPGVSLRSVLCDPSIYETFRPATQVQEPATADRGTVRLLPDGDYYRALIAAIRGARRSLRVSMFFFSNPTSQRHPNYALIGELLRAHGRGVDIRIVLDTDRKTDIYNSRRINKPVKDYLTGKGIAVRFDAPESVNHSKFLVADGTKVLIGSHNWTSGSFRRLHDLSLEIESEEIAARCMHVVDRHFGRRR